jgi:hypothetical protein
MGAEDFVPVKTENILEKKPPSPERQVDYGIPPTGAMQVRTQYATAVHVIKPRNLEEVQRKCLEEAAIAGDEFYYSWKQGGEDVEGLTIGAALAMVRNFGNCAVDCKVEDAQAYYVFHGAFIDLETGFNLIRPFRQRKESPKKKDGTDIYKGERGADIVFQIGASKAIRNVVLNAVPKWLSVKVMERAKENVIGKIEKMGLEKARAMVTTKAKSLNIPIARVSMIYGKEETWDVESIVKITSALRAIDDGVESVDSLFALTDAQQKPAIEEDPVKKESSQLRDGLLGKTDKAKTEHDLLVVEESRVKFFDSGKLSVDDSKAVEDAINKKKATLKT